MNIELSGRHFDLTDALKEHVEKKLNTISRFRTGVDDIHVILEVTSGTNHVHIQLRGNHLKLDSKSKSHDIYVAFDDAFDSLERQMRKYKERMHDHSHRKRQNSNGRAPSSTFYVAAVESDFEDGILIDDTMELPRLKTKDAIIEYEIETDSPFVFHNTETGILSVVYSTPSGRTQVVELVERQ